MTTRLIRPSTDGTTRVLETMTYDHAGRMDQNKHKLNTQTEQIISELNYNVKDELIEKNLGYVNASSMLQSVDYTYNNQGWLTRINDFGIGGTYTPLVACPTVQAMPNPGTASSTAERFVLS